MTEMPARPAVRSRSIIASIVASWSRLCAVIPYALVALGLRFVMARVFFLSGQTKIEGPRIPIDLNLRGFDELSIVLPAEIKASTFQLFETDYASLPIPPTVAAYLSPMPSSCCRSAWSSALPPASRPWACWS